MVRERLCWHGALLGVLMLCVSSSIDAAFAQTPSGDASPRDVYQAACAACHAADGRGAAASLVGFDTPLPDFTDCSYATRENDADWFAIAHDGGPTRAFSRRMPAFGEALTPGDIQKAIARIREFCSDRRWPRGELNLPRPLVTEKAYPEDELVLATVVGRGPSSVTNQLTYERRLGSRHQFEIAVPLAAQERAEGGWTQGLGDVAFALKSVLHHSLEGGRILSVGGEVALPTGKENQGLGRGTTVVEPFAAFGQLLPRDAFFHVQAGAEFPADRAKSEREAFWRVAVGRTFQQARFGRAWSPMVEVLAARELDEGEPVLWDVLPQMQVSLSRRQHILFNGGVSIPVNQRDGRHLQVITYFLWDWYDGGLLQGWR